MDTEHKELKRLALRAIAQCVIDAGSMNVDDQVQLLRIVEWIARRETYGRFARAEQLRKQLSVAFVSTSVPESTLTAVGAYLKALTSNELGESLRAARSKPKTGISKMIPPPEPPPKKSAGLGFLSKEEKERIDRMDRNTVGDGQS